MTRGMKDCIYKFLHIRAKYKGALSEIIAITVVYLMVILVIWRHMRIISDVLWKRIIAALMAADKPIVLITYPDLRRRCLQYCRRIVISVQY